VEQQNIFQNRVIVVGDCYHSSSVDSYPVFPMRHCEGDIGRLCPR